MPAANRRLLTRSLCAAVATVVLITPARAQAPQVAVVFAPALTEKFELYGEDEAAVLRSAIVTAVARATAGQPVPAGLLLTVIVQDVEPTRPTRAQAAADPTLDIFRTKYLGGARLTGELRDASQRLLTTVSYRYYPVDIKFGSVSRDPWADARLAIDQFAVELAAACRDPGLKAASVPR